MRFLAFLFLVACGPDHTTIKVHNDVNGCWVDLRHGEEHRMLLPGETWTERTK